MRLFFELQLLYMCWAPEQKFWPVKACTKHNRVRLMLTTFLHNPSSNFIVTSCIFCWDSLFKVVISSNCRTLMVTRTLESPDIVFAIPIALSSSIPIINSGGQFQDTSSSGIFLILSLVLFTFQLSSNAYNILAGVFVLFRIVFGKSPSI